MEPDNAEALENRAAAHSDLGELRPAREDYDALIRLEPDNAVALYSPCYSVGKNVGKNFVIERKSPDIKLH